MKRIWVVLVAFMVCGCAAVVDAPRNIIGFSMRDIEDVRGQSIYQSYNCELDKCFSAAIYIAEDKKLQVFMKDERRFVLVLMGVPGVVDTTEVGLFFSAIDKGVRVEVASRSSQARRIVARMIFGEMDNRFTKI
ncbi:MAG: hypothetical protein HGA80_00305 [Candidatus Omnitrophica bacterium]|nr:hypothetical protein [Candidatus Omnitrophota bacterium]